MHNNDKLTEVAECLLSDEQVRNACDLIAQQINQDYQGKSIVLWPVLNSAIVFAGLLLPKLAMEVRVSCLRVTRYANNTASKELRWLSEPSEQIQGQHILVCDDIFDEGITLKEVCEFAKKEGAASVKAVVMTNKLHDRKPANFSPDYVATEVPDRYVFGMGMDYQDFWRNAPGIWAVK